MYAIFLYFLIFYLFLPAVGLAQTTIGDVADAPVGSQLVSSEMVAIGILSLISTAASIVTLGVKSKGWPAWLQPIMDALNTLALNIFKNKNADAKEE